MVIQYNILGWNSHNGSNICTQFTPYCWLNLGLYWHSFLVLVQFSLYIRYSFTIRYKRFGHSVQRTFRSKELFILALTPSLYCCSNEWVVQKKMRNNADLQHWSIGWLASSLTWVLFVYIQNIRLQTLFQHLKITTQNHIRWFWKNKNK